MCRMKQLEEESQEMTHLNLDTTQELSALSTRTKAQAEEVAQHLASAQKRTLRVALVQARDQAFKLVHRKAATPSFLECYLCANR